ncbi:MAG: hypothetical protein JWO36_5718 [Myxococcales bacterium]|nr:hypothetical protein [Myxococcales bacterium]
MAQRKSKLTVTVDRELVRVANAAVAAGKADSVSGWVNQALAELAAKERRLNALAHAISKYEADHGEITAAEIAAQQRSDHRSALVVQIRSRRSRTG